MKLITTCSKCNKKTKVKAIMIEDRIQLAQAKGENFENKCEHCGHSKKTHVDSVKAVAGNNVLIAILASIVAAFVVAFIFLKLGIDKVSIYAFPFAIPFIALQTTRKTEQSKIKIFNMTYMKSENVDNRELIDIKFRK